MIPAFLKKKETRTGETNKAKIISSLLHFKQHPNIHYCLVGVSYSFLKCRDFTAIIVMRI